MKMKPKGSEIMRPGPSHPLRKTGKRRKVLATKKEPPHSPEEVGHLISALRTRKGERFSTLGKRLSRDSPGAVVEAGMILKMHGDGEKIDPKLLRLAQEIFPSTKKSKK